MFHLSNYLHVVFKFTVVTGIYFLNILMWHSLLGLLSTVFISFPNCCDYFQIMRTFSLGNSKWQVTTIMMQFLWNYYAITMRIILNCHWSFFLLSKKSNFGLSKVNVVNPEYHFFCLLIKRSCLRCSFYFIGNQVFCFTLLLFFKYLLSYFYQFKCIYFWSSNFDRVLISNCTSSG